MGNVDFFCCLVGVVNVYFGVVGFCFGDCCIVVVELEGYVDDVIVFSMQQGGDYGVVDIV